MKEQASVQLVLVQGEHPVRLLLDRDLPPEGRLVISVATGGNAPEGLAVGRFDLSIYDLEVEGIARVETFWSGGREGTGSEVLVVTPTPVAESSPSAPLTRGSYSYLTRPLRPRVVQALLQAAERDQGGDPASEREVTYGASSVRIRTRSPAMRAVLDTVDLVGASTASVLIQGETGSGKSLFARALHEASKRKDGSFVAINCGAFQEELLASELFGHEKGAFTGASTAKRGLLELADGGTLFLDEIAEMTTAMQAKLLHVLDTGELRRVGGTRLLRTDARVVAATNRDLQAAVAAGRFRDDLYFRLNVVRIRVPPLRERPEDISIVVEQFLDLFAGPDGPKQMSGEAMRYLETYAWPGNVREIRNAVEALVLLAPGPVIEAADLPEHLRQAEAPSPSGSAEEGLPSLAEMELKHIHRALDETSGNRSQAARLLGIDVKTLRKKLADA